MNGIIVGEFKMTGANTIDVDLVAKQWNHLWMLAEWKRNNSWRIIKYIRKDSPITKIKLTISSQQADELIKRLDLKPVNIGFKSSYSWRRREDMEYLEE